MSTNDVPGAVAANGDVLSTGCWAEHKDGSKIFVLGVESNTVFYHMFDNENGDIVRYSDRMQKKEFEKFFSYKNKSDIKWTWHDKTPFPWDEFILKGTKGGFDFPSASEQISATEKVVNSLKKRGRKIDKKKVDEQDYNHLINRAVDDIKDALGKALDGLKK